MIVSIAGPFRTEKSYFLNYFADLVEDGSSMPPSSETAAGDEAQPPDDADQPPDPDSQKSDGAPKSGEDSKSPEVKPAAASAVNRRIFPLRPTSTTDVNTDSGEVLVHILPGCMDPLPAHRGTTLLLLDTPGLFMPNRWGPSGR